MDRAGAELGEAYLDIGEFGAWRLGMLPEAGPFCQRAVAIFEKTDHQEAARSIERYGGLLRRMGREAEAKLMKARAEAISTGEGQTEGK